MNAIHPEEPESKEDDSNLAAVSEVEAGIRDFVRNDIAYLRRPAPGAGSAVAGADLPMDSNTEATVNSVNSLIQPICLTKIFLCSHFCTSSCAFTAFISAACVVSFRSSAERICSSIVFSHTMW